MDISKGKTLISTIPYKQRVKQAIEQLASGGSLPTNTMQGVYGEYGNRTSDSVVIESQFNVPKRIFAILI
ncbi:hypothetical protein GJ496_011606 [Pomphorhynchus laevis]|nr:hypothetical protein GJ496_011606 [Pomphorhynchus laevis]